MYTHGVVTLWYRAPEVLGSKHYSTPGAYGVSMHLRRNVDIATPFPGDSEIDQIFRIFRSLERPPWTWPGVSDLPGRSRHFQSGSPKAESICSHARRPRSAPRKITYLRSLKEDRRSGADPLFDSMPGRGSGTSAAAASAGAP